MLILCIFFSPEGAQNKDSKLYSTHGTHHYPLQLQSDALAAPPGNFQALSLKDRLFWAGTVLNGSCPPEGREHMWHRHLCARKGR